MIKSDVELRKVVDKVVDEVRVTDVHTTLYTLFLICFGIVTSL